MKSGSKTWRRGWVLLALEALVFVFLVALFASIVWSVKRGAPRRRELIAVTDRLSEAIEEGRFYGAQNNAIVSAHFSLGTPAWSVASGAAEAGPTTSPTLSLKIGPAANENPRATWRFLTFRSLSGQPVGPSFVFFPDGNLQGGEIELGWPDLRRQMRMDSEGRITCRFTAPHHTSKSERSKPPFYDDKWKGATQ